MYHTQTPHTPNTNTVVALAQAETEVKLELQVGARLTERYCRNESNDKHLKNFEK